MSTHVVVSALPPVESVPKAVTQISWLPGSSPAVIVEYVTIAGPFCGVAGVVATAVAAPPSTLISTLVSVEPIRSGIRSGRSLGSGTLTQVPPLTATSARSPSLPPVQAPPAIAIEFAIVPVAWIAATAELKAARPPWLLSPSDTKTRSFFESVLALSSLRRLLQGRGVVRPVCVAVLARVLADVVVEAAVREDDRADRRVAVARGAQRVVPSGRRHVGLDRVGAEDHETDMVHGAAGGGCVVETREERLLAGQDVATGATGVAGAPRGVEHVDDGRLRCAEADARRPADRHLDGCAVGEELRSIGRTVDAHLERGSVRQGRAARARPCWEGRDQRDEPEDRDQTRTSQGVRFSVH